MNFIHRLNNNPAQPMQVTYAVLLLYAFYILSLLVYAVGVIVTMVSYSEQYGYIVVDVIFNSFGYFLSFLVVRKISEGKNWARLLLLVVFCFVLLVSLIGSQMIFSGRVSEIMCKPKIKLI